MFPSLRRPRRPAPPTPVITAELQGDGTVLITPSYPGVSASVVAQLRTVVRADGVEVGSVTGATPFVHDPSPAGPLDPGTIVATPGDGQVTIGQGVAPSGGSETYTHTLFRSLVEGESGVSLGVVALPYVDGGRTNGVAVYYTAWVNDGSTSTGTPQVSATPAAAGDSELVAGLNFEDGTFGVFSAAADTAEHTISIVDDPTPGELFGGGKVARFWFKRSGAAGDVNSAIGLPPTVAAQSNPLGLTWGERFYWRGKLYLPAYPLRAPVDPSHVLMKFLYIQFGDWDAATDSTGHSKRSNIIINGYGLPDGSGLTLGLASGHYKVGTYDQMYGPATLPFDQLHELELEAQLNTNGNADGWVRLWLNGVMVKERVGVELVVEPEGLPDRVYVFALLTGDQEQWSPETEMENERYWDEIEFRTARP